MKPIVLIHGYSAESQTTAPASIHAIYGDLADDLKATYSVVEIDLSRYLSLSDAVSILDVARALNMALTQNYPRLIASGFNVIIHSTGALVIRNWIKLFSPQPSPVASIIYLAGANFGSGWAGIGQGELARWGRYVLENGAQRGVKVLQALELGSNQTLDMHLYFTKTGTRMLEDYQVQEYILNGTQANPAWFTLPIRYGKEDGSDGTVRVSGANLNFNYLSIIPNDGTTSLQWKDIVGAIGQANAHQPFSSYYRIDKISQPAVDRKEIPLAIICQCAHTGDKDYGIVCGPTPKTQVRRIIKAALAVPDRDPEAWQALVNVFHNETKTTYDTARNLPKPGPFTFLSDLRNQYDAHAQVILRLRDQDDQPLAISSSDIFFISNQTEPGTTPIQSLIEDKVTNKLTPNICTYYFRINRFNPDHQDWDYLLQNVQDFALEVTAVEPLTPNEDPVVTYVPMRISFSRQQVQQFLQAHRTTIIDIQLARIPKPDNYLLITA
jgi:pimeloyl-ACP methyl ester carboxylesterase